MQRITIQRGEAANGLGTLPVDNDSEDLYYVCGDFFGALTLKINGVLTKGVWISGLGNLQPVGISAKTFAAANSIGARSKRNLLRSCMFVKII